jgi:hypothetical protein
VEDLVESIVRSGLILDILVCHLAVALRLVEIVVLSTRGIRVGFFIVEVVVGVAQLLFIVRQIVVYLVLTLLMKLLET